MRFKQQASKASIPQVNLVPMMDVLMSVLIFFIVTSTVFTGQQLGSIQVPVGGKGVKSETLEPLVVGIDRNGKLLIANQEVTITELTKQMEAYLAKKPGGEVVVKADKELAYEKVTQLLKKMSKIGGDRILLAIEKNSKK